LYVHNNYIRVQRSLRKAQWRENKKKRKKQQLLLLFGGDITEIRKRAKKEEVKKGQLIIE